VVQFLVIQKCKIINYTRTRCLSVCLSVTLYEQYEMMTVRRLCTMDITAVIECGIKITIRHKLITKSNPPPYLISARFACCTALNMQWTLIAVSRLVQWMQAFTFGTPPSRFLAVPNVTTYHAVNELHTNCHLHGTDIRGGGSGVGTS